MKFIKNQGVKFILELVTLVLTIVSIILYTVNKSLPYFTEVNPSFQIILFLIFALLCELANVAVGFTPFKDNKIVGIVCGVLEIATAFFLVGAAIYFMYDRVYYYGVALFSDLENGNAVARSSCIGAIVGTAFMLVSGLVSIVTSFFNRPQVTETK